MPPDGAGLEIRKSKYTPPPEPARQVPFGSYLPQPQKTEKPRIPQTDLRTGVIPNEDFLREAPKTSLEKNRPLRPDEPTRLYPPEKKAALEGRSEALVQNAQKAAAMKAGLQREFGEDVPHLEQKIRDFDAQIRDLRVQRKATDTWLMRTFSNGNQRLEQIDASEKRLMKERDALRDRMEAILHPEGTHGRKITQEQVEQEKPLSDKDVLHVQRKELEEKLSNLPKWPASMLPWNSMAKDRILDALDENAKSMAKAINLLRFQELAAQEVELRKQTEQR